MAEVFGVLIADAPYRRAAARRKVAQPPLGAPGNRAVLGRDWIAMRVLLGVTQKFGDMVFQGVRKDMLQSVRLLVDLIPRNVQGLVQKQFEQSVMAHDF